MRVLIVEDEASIAEPLADGLRREGHDVSWAATAAEALAATIPDLVLLDLRLPDMDGYAVCRSIRERSNVPIIMLTARGEEIDKVLGLELGADDYMVKPFGFRELLARINAVMRRHQTAPAGDAEAADEAQLNVGRLRINRRAHRVHVGDNELELTPTEFELLWQLATNEGNVCTRDDLLRDVWQTTWASSGKTVDVHVASLRRKLGDGRWIETVRGMGYRLVEHS